MFACNEPAILYACLGQRGGKPAFTEEGIAFRCRSEPAWGHRSSGDAVDRVADTRIFARDVEARPGDRVQLNGKYYRIAEVQPMRGWNSIHHLEILAKAEGKEG